MAKQDHDQKVTKDDELELKYFVDNPEELRAVYQHLKENYRRTEKTWQSNPVSFYYDAVIRDDEGRVLRHLLREKKLTLRTRGTAGRGRPEMSIKTDGVPTREGVLDRKEFEHYISQKRFDLTTVSDPTFNIIVRELIMGGEEDDNDLVQKFREAGRKIVGMMNMDDPDAYTRTVLEVREILQDNNVEQIFTTDANRLSATIEVEENGKKAIFEIALDDCKFKHRDLNGKPIIETTMGRTFEIEIEFKLDGSDQTLTKDEVSRAAGKISDGMKTVAPSMVLNPKSKAQVGFDFLEKFDKEKAWSHMHNDVLHLRKRPGNDNAGKQTRRGRKNPSARMG